MLCAVLMDTIYDFLALENRTVVQFCDIPRNLGICQSAQLAMLSSPATRTPQPLKNLSFVTILHVPVKNNQNIT